MLHRIVLIAAAIGCGIASQADAHHSGAAYDNDHPATMEGTVKSVNWTNPHITFVVEKNGSISEPTSTWILEVSSPGVLTRSGWTKNSLRPGDHALFRFAPLRNGGAGGYLTKVTLPSGQELSFSLTPAEK